MMIVFHSVNFNICCKLTTQLLHELSSNVRTELCFLNWTEPNSFRTESKF